jgi:hypothetical protein
MNAAIVSQPAAPSGHWRVRVQTAWHPSCWAIVGTFPEAVAALQFSVDMVQAADGQVRAVRIEHRNNRRWKPAWRA